MIEDYKEYLEQYYNYSEETKTAFIFVFGDTPEGAGGMVRKGDMPIGHQWGFIFGGMDNRTLAHELGHGLFTLRHTFDKDYGLEAQSTDNLMDYAGGSELIKYQWDILHDPARWGAPFQRDGEGASLRDDICFTVENLDINFGNDLLAFPDTSLYDYVSTNFQNILDTIISNRSNLIIDGFSDWKARSSSYNSKTKAYLVNTILQKLNQNNMPIRLSENGIYLGKTTLENHEYNVAAYCKKNIIDITKYETSKLCDLVDNEFIKVAIRRNYFMISFLRSSGDAEMIIQVLDFDIGHIKTWLGSIGIFEEQTDVDYYNNLWRIMAGGDTAKVNILFEKEVLSIDEITNARALIDSISDSTLIKEYYIDLQKKVPYFSQRDNQTEPNVTCNVTSLAGALYVLGLTRPCSNCEEGCNDRETIADYLYCLGESIYDPFNRTLVSHWIGVAELFGTISSTFLIIENNTNLLSGTVKTKLESGCGVLLSAFLGNYGHIVRLLDVTNEGIIVDDPYGELIDGAQREINGNNYDVNDKNSNENLGSENLWLWDDIQGTHNGFPNSETFIIKYVVIFEK